MIPDNDLSTVWISKIKAGDSDAADAIWDKCFPELLRYAQRRLEGMPAVLEAAEDVALSALNSFMQRAGAGKFKRLEQCEDLWKLLYCIAGCKVAAYRRKRSNQSVTIDPEVAQDIVSVTSRLPQVMNDLLDLLNDDKMRKIGEYHLCGYTNREIANLIGCSTETVRRKVNFIKSKWERELERWLSA